MPRQAGSKNRNYPPLPLSRALEVPAAIENEASGMTVSKLTLAELLDTTPTSSTLRDLVASSRFYGLSTGGINATEFSLTDLGRRAVDDDPGTRDGALKEAVMQVPPYKIFFDTFQGKKIPAARPMREFLTRDAEVDESRVEEVISFILDDASTAGLVRNVKGADYVDFTAAASPPPSSDDESPELLSDAEDDAAHDDPGLPDFAQRKPKPNEPSEPPSDITTNRQVFITHGKNKKIVEQLKELLTYGKFVRVVSVERETVSQPVPEKVLGDMRSCAAAVIHVGAEQNLLNEKGEQVVVLNPNVLIEIGAAMMQYGRNFILLVEEGTELPSNLQGLYEVRYSGDGLDHESTMKLLKAFNDFG